MYLLVYQRLADIHHSRGFVNTWYGYLPAAFVGGRYHIGGRLLCVENMVRELSRENVGFKIFRENLGGTKIWCDLRRNMKMGLV